MNMHSHSHLNRRETQGKSRARQAHEGPVKTGLWKLLAAAALILLGLGVVVDIFEDTESEFSAPNPAEQTENG